MIDVDQVRVLLKELGYTEEDIAILIEQVEHFEGEARERDAIVEEYLGKECIERIVGEIIAPINSRFRVKGELFVLDVGAGSGTFTSRVRDMLTGMGFNPYVYGLDISPGMLDALSRKGIVAVWGVADRIKESIRLNSRYLGLDVPDRFDVVMSTLAFHHFPDPLSVLRSIHSVLRIDGVAVIIGVLRHGYEALRDELKDVHLGFSVDEFSSYAREVFPLVDVEVLDGVYCRVSGYEVGLFKAVLRTI